MWKKSDTLQWAGRNLYLNCDDCLILMCLFNRVSLFSLSLSKSLNVVCSHWLIVYKCHSRNFFSFWSFFCLEVAPRCFCFVLNHPSLSLGHTHTHTHTLTHPLSPSPFFALYPRNCLAIQHSCYSKEFPHTLLSHGTPETRCVAMLTTWLTGKKAPRRLPLLCFMRLTCGWTCVLLAGGVTLSGTGMLPPVRSWSLSFVVLHLIKWFIFW